MSARSEYFLDQFDPGFRTHVIEFAKRLTALSKKYDVLIFLARKAACLADCFDELGLSTYNCVITSSRVLDMNVGWMKGKKVAIIDDALISGTTIYQALSKLSSNGITDVDVSILSIDDYWWNRDLVKPIAPYFELNSEQTSQLCANIVQAISVLPRPYTIDYPLYKRLRILQTDFHELSNSANWIVYEATSSHQDKHNIVNLTIIPSDEKCIAFFDKLGFEPDKHFLLKLRLYAMRTGDAYWCQLLPIVIFPPMEIGEVEKIFNRIIEHSRHKELPAWFQTGNNNDDITGKLRLVQYYVASQLGSIWHEEMVTKVDGNITLEQDFKNLNFLFPPPISDILRNICSDDNIHFSDLNIKYAPPVADQEQEVEEEFDEMVALYRLSNPFLKLYKEKELAARQLVKKLGEKVFSDENYRKIIDRLNQGYSLKDLKSFIAQIANHIHKGKLVSYFLDLYIDKGVVVPITCVQGNLVFRAFRHGEDVEFSENEMRLCVSMLDKFTKEFGSSKLAHTIVEKLLVLFVRIGIQKNFLTVSTTPLSDFSSIGIRYYLHGAIVGSFDKKIYKTNLQNSLTNVLLEAGYLRREKFKDQYTILPAPTSGTDPKGLSEANLLGSIIGNLMNPKKSKALGLDELILIATIPSLTDAVGALAAEIYIFQSFFIYENHKFFPEFTKNKLALFKEIRRKNAYTAINSGTWKFENFRKGTAWKAIQDAKKLFDNHIYEDIWRTFWPSMGEQTGSTSPNPELEKLLDRLADWLYTTRFYINLIEVALTKSKDEFRKAHYQTEIKSMLDATRIHMPHLHTYLNKLYLDAAGKFLSDNLKRDKLYSFCLDKLKENFQFSRQLLAEVDPIANNFGKIERVIFCEHVVLVDFKKFSIEHRKLKEAFNKVITDVRYEAKKQGVQFFEIPYQYSAIKTGLWISTHGKNARRWLFQFAEKLVVALDNVASLKFTFFLNLDFFRICKRISSNEYEAPLFWDIAKELLRKKFKLHESHEVVYFTAQQSNKSAIESELKNELPGFSMLEKGEKELIIESPYSLKFISNHYTKEQKNKVKNLMDIGIITIVTPELVAVTDNFKQSNGYKESRGNLSARTYRFGTIKDKNGKELNAVVVQAKEQGNRSIVSVYNALAEEFNPQLVVLLGIGGSIHKDAGICDVVIGDSVYYYDRRAETEQGTQRRADAFKIGSYAMELIQNFLHSSKSEEPKLPAAPDSPDGTFKALVGPIGSGEAVIKYQDAEVRSWLNSVNNKTLAVETEASGFGQQFYEDDLNYSRRAKGMLILRGISDKADIEKDDKYRLAASKNAMTTLVEIIKANTLD